MREFGTKPSGACGESSLAGIAFQDEEGRFLLADMDPGRIKCVAVPLCARHVAEHQKSGHAVSQLVAPMRRDEAPFWKGTVCHFTASSSKRSAPAPVATVVGGKVPLEKSDLEDL